MDSVDSHLERLRCGKCQLIFRMNLSQGDAACPRCNAMFEFAIPPGASIFWYTKQYLWTLSEAIFDYRHFFYHSFLKPYTPAQSFFTISSFIVFFILTFAAGFENLFYKTSHSGVEMVYELGVSLAMAMLIWPFSKLSLWVLSFLASRAISWPKRQMHSGSEKLVIGYALGSALIFVPFRQIGVMLSMVWFLIMATLGFSIRFELSRQRAAIAAFAPFMLVSLMLAAITAVAS